MELPQSEKTEISMVEAVPSSDLHHVAVHGLVEPTQLFESMNMKYA